MSVPSLYPTVIYPFDYLFSYLLFPPLNILDPFSLHVFSLSHLLSDIFRLPFPFFLFFLLYPLFSTPLALSPILPLFFCVYSCQPISPFPFSCPFFCSSSFLLCLSILHLHPSYRFPSRLLDFSYILYTSFISFTNPFLPYSFSLSLFLYPILILFTQFSLVTSSSTSYSVLFSCTCHSFPFSLFSLPFLPLSLSHYLLSIISLISRILFPLSSNFPLPSFLTAPLPFFASISLYRLTFTFLFSFPCILHPLPCFRLFSSFSSSLPS